MDADVSQPTVLPPPPPPEAAAVVGSHLEQISAFAEILADTGVSHGLIGPREVPRLWDRHLLNCAVVADAFPVDAWVLDIGSGAGLPGLALAIVRPDLRLTLVEPMLRRTTWLETTIRDLKLDNAEVRRGRAEDFHRELKAPYATARAVARLDKLARWTFPLLAAGGVLVAMKGSSAHTELAEDEAALRRLGMVDARVTEHGLGVLESPVLTVDLVVGESKLSKRVLKRRG
jgi:16S rRNA (guanine527-N7)-methyltransferase